MTLSILQRKLDQLNNLCKSDFHLFHYTRAKNPYGLMTSDSQEIMRGSKWEVYQYLDGAITGINDYRLAHNLR